MATASFVTKFDQGQVVYYHDPVTDIVKRYFVARIVITKGWQQGADEWSISYEVANCARPGELAEVREERELSSMPVFPPMR